MQDGAHVFAFFRSMGRSGGPIPPNASYAPVQTRVSAGRPDAVFHATKKTGPRPPHSRYAACT